MQIWGGFLTESTKVYMRAFPQSEVDFKAKSSLMPLFNKKAMANIIMVVYFGIH